MRLNTELTKEPSLCYTRPYLEDVHIHLFITVTYSGPYQYAKFANGCKV